MPASITIAPGLIMSPVTSPGTPTAATRISALRVCSLRFDVFEWQIVTVALSPSKSIAAGRPTTLLRPITTAFFPLILTPVLLISCIMLLGVQGANAGLPETRLPTFRRWKPSTSLCIEICEMTSSEFMCFGSGI